MDRLPRDIAAERLHHDIVRLLDEHVPRPSAVQTIHHQAPNNLSSMNNNVNSPPSQVMNNDNFSPGVQNPSQPKPKKRTIKPDHNVGGDLVDNSKSSQGPKPPRRPSNRKKKSTDSLLHGGGGGGGMGVINHATDSSPLSGDSSTMSPPDFHSSHNMFNVPPTSMAISQPNLSSIEPHQHGHGNTYGTLQINKAPPPYEDCFNNKAVSFHNLQFSNYSNNMSGNLHNGSQQQYLQQNSPFPSPQSVASQFQASSPTSYAGSPPQVTSPNKRPSLPTSPTHMAAL